MRTAWWTLALMLVLAAVAVAALSTVTSADVTQTPSLQWVVTGEDGVAAQSNPPWQKRCTFCKCGHQGGLVCG